MSSKFLAIGLILLLPACASIIDGKTQAIAINTNPPKADCVLNRQGVPVAQIDSTPGSAIVEKTRDNIIVDCKKDGYQDASYVNKSGVDGWVFGNIAFGGLIGWGIDEITGAVNKYDPQINMSLVPVVDHKEDKDD